MNSLNDLIKFSQAKGKKRIAVCATERLPVLLSIKQAMELALISPILIGNKNKIEILCKEINFKLVNITIVDKPDPFKAATTAVKLVKESQADILMKGMIGTAPFLKAILHKENGLPNSGLLCHLALCESPNYHKILGVTDVAINIAPTFNDKVTILTLCNNAYHQLGYTLPKIAIIAPVEVVNEKIESTVHASMLHVMNQRNQISGCIIDGPLALDTAISKEAAHHKGLESEVAGDADLLLVPDLNSGNILYKTLVYAGNAVTAAIVLGAKSPIVLTSRADSEKSKLLSIALASLIE